MNALACDDLEMRKRGGCGLQNAVCERRSGDHKLNASCMLRQTALSRHFSVVAGALVEVSGEFYDKLFIRSLKLRRQVPPLPLC